MDRNAKESWHLIMQATNALREHALSAAGKSCAGKRAEKITIAQQRVLSIVFAHPEGVMLKDIAGELNLTPGAVSQTIEVLVREGILTRTISRQDRRAVIIEPTEECRTVHRETNEVFNRVMESVLRKVTPDERESFMKILKMVIEKAGNSRETSKSGASSASQVWRSQA